MIFALVILWGSHPEEVLLLLRDAGSGLLLAGFAHILPMAGQRARLANTDTWCKPPNVAVDVETGLNTRVGELNAAGCPYRRQTRFIPDSAAFWSELYGRYAKPQ